MQVSVESREGLERRMTVEIPAEMVNGALEKRLREIARNAKIDGFRPGKVPLSIIRQRYSGQARQEVFGDLVQSTYFQALAKENLQPAGEPSIEPLQMEPAEGLGYVAVFEVMPEVKLQDLSEKVIVRPQVEVTDADLDAMILKLRKQRTTWNEITRKAQEGDQVTIDFKGFIDGEAFDGGSAEGVPLVLGTSSMIPGFEEGLLGVESGENRTLELNFPEEYRAKHLAGKAAKFDVVVKKIAEPILPEVDDEFAKVFGVAEGGVNGLHKEIRSNMERELQEKIRGVLKEQAMDLLLEVNEVTVPKALIGQEAAALQQQTKQNMAQNGQTSSIDLPLNLFEDQAKRRVALGLILGEVIRENKIELDNERVRTRVEQFAQSYEDPQEVIDYYLKDKKQLAAIENVVLEEQVVDWVMEQVKVEDKARNFDDLMNNSHTGTGSDS
ncbi:MAG: trigger factor [Chromatiaceae bacterium]|nr:trigger factor [Gammaproteobacteria bacterium]MCP5427253.1 trigger factor [Chromatiaceae bacterium]MCB1861172.1 trigger factor [Gammaproteobacteria bacterium]MCB1872211.1 trigger factor [Gammaproteobacteria bacterium]MCB1879696.1 trigger factor [Gammaproteobacteria bacterium]